MALKLNSSGGGSVTIDPVSTASNVTITIPATTGGSVVVADSSNNVYATTFTGALSGNATTATSVGSLTGIATVAPLVAGTAAVGTSTLGARQDHVHPAQTTISGNAGSATTFSTTRTNYKAVTDAAVAGQLMWKHYGNNHTIFDASNSTSPQGGAINNTNAATAWSATYPTLMGWNGTSTYGVRVDSARVTDALSTATGSAPSYSARAWVNFNGTGTIAIRADGNVSTIGDAGVGIYNINFTTALPDANYAVTCTMANAVGANLQAPRVRASTNEGAAVSKTTGTVQIANMSSGNYYDAVEMYTAIFG